MCAWCRCPRVPVSILFSESSPNPRHCMKTLAMGKSFSNFSDASSEENSPGIPHRVVFTSTQKKILAESWQMVASDVTQFGVDFFIRFFLLYPSYKDLFPAFRDESLDELRNCIGLRAHGTVVMHMLMTCLTNIGDTEYISKLLKHIVRGHHETGIRTGQFTQMFHLFADIMTTIHPCDKESDRELVKDTWTKATDVLLGVINSIIRDIEDKPIT